MKLINSLVYALLSMTTLAILASCQDEDFGYTAEDVKKGAFGRNFENEYGKIDPDQSWDLTNYMTRTAKYDDEALVDYLLRNGGQTRASGAYNPIGSLPDNLSGIEIDGEGYYHVQANTIKWLRSFLKEGKNNTSLGSAFSLRAPSNKIAIVPIYQGFANMDWSLYIRHDGTDTKLWTESENILVSNDGKDYKTDNTKSWETKGTTYGTSQTVYDHEIKAKPIVVDLGSTSVKEFNLFLKIDDNNGQSSYANTGTEQLSSMGMMLALPCPLPTNLGETDGEDNLAMIVGVEDSDLAGSDWDMNDVCFLIIGLPALPNRIDITRKRYMCEDLGNTYDFDFNDIVVDVMEVVTSEYDHDKNNFVQKGDATQIATIKHVCGTLPFQVKVGNTLFNKVTDPTNETQTLADLKDGVADADIVNLPTTRGVNWNPEFSRRISGWDHNTNNIEIQVSTTTNNNIDVLTDAFGDKNGAVEVNGDEHIYHITFAERGEAPLIIATDPTLMWMDEHTHIPEAWWKEGTFKPTGSADNDTPGTPGSGEGNENWADIPEHLVTPDADGNVVIWDAADHADAGNDEEKGIFEGWKGMQFQTEFLDALFEGYTIIEFQFGDGNTAQTFRLCKVTNNWETVIATPTISGGKATYTFSASALTDYNLGVAILNIGDSGKKMVVSKVVMKMPQSYTLTVNNGDYGTVTVNPAANSDGKYTEGTQVTLTVTPTEGWYFDQWSDGNKANPRKVTISSDLELTPSYIDNDPFEAGNVTLHGTHTFDNGWTSFDIAKNDLNLHQGDVIVFRVTSFSADAKIEFFNLDWQSKRDVTPDGGINGSFLVEITEAMYNDYKEGLKIQGHNVALESVTKRCDHADPDPETPEDNDPKGDAITGTTIARGSIDLYDGNAVTIGEWDKNVTLAASKFNDAKVGDVIIVHTSGLYTNSEAGLRENTNNWPAIADGREYFSIDGDYELTIDQTILNKIQASGLIITGKYYTIEDITLRTTSGSGEEPEQPGTEPTIEELSLDNLGTGWGSTYNSSTHTITFNEGAWQGRGWWFGSKDCRNYNSVVIEFDVALPCQGLVVVEYDSGEASKQAENAGSTSIKCSLSSNKTSVKQIYIQNAADNVSFVLKRAYLTSE